MKIAHFSDTFFPEINGVSVSVDQYAKLQMKKNEVSLYVPACTKGKLIERKGKLQIHRYFSVPVPVYKNAQLTVPDILDMYKSMVEFDPDVVHFHTPATIGLVGILLAKIMKKPLVGTYHTLFSEVLDYVSVRKLLDKYLTAIDKAAAGVGLDLGLLRNGEKLNKNETTAQKLTWTIVNRVYNYADMIICPSDSISGELVRRKMKRKKIKVICNGLDINRFSSKTGYRLNNRILHVGRLGFEKNIDVVIRAFEKISKRLPKLSLIIAGDGPARKDLEKLVSDLGIKHRVKFLGMIRRDKLPGIYRSADVFVTASDMETLGLVVLESMACGLPVVAVNKYAMKNLVEEGVSGLKVKPRDVEGMAERITRLMTDEKLRQKMGENGRRISEKFGWEEMNQKLEQVYEDLTVD